MTVALGRHAPFLLVLLLSAGLVQLSSACGGHEAAHWSKTVLVKGRQRSLLSMHGRKCGADAPGEEVMKKVEEDHDKHMKKRAPKEAGEITTYEIKTYVTVVGSSDGTGIGTVPDKKVMDQMTLMNSAYGVNAAGSGVKWVFKLMGIKHVTGPSMCDKAGELKIKKAHRQGGPGDLNLYFTDLSECGLLGFSTWPWQVAGDQVADGVVIHYDTMPGGQEAPYNMGRTCIHETGHWMGLYHTFQNGCMRGGDMVADTPFSAGPTQGCPATRKSCPSPGSDPIHNYMDYSDDSCMHQFSAQQHQRMEGQYRQYRTAAAKQGGAAMAAAKELTAAANRQPSG